MGVSGGSGVSLPSGGATPGGTSGQLQYNNGGVLGGVSGTSVNTDGTLNTAFAPEQLAQIQYAKRKLLPNFRAKINNVKWQRGNCRIICLGDSTTRGYGGNALSSGNTEQFAYPAYLASYFNSVGVSAHHNSIMGIWGGTPASYTMDSRVTLGSDWTAAPGDDLSLGGVFVYSTADTGNPFLFAPAVNEINPTTMVDTFIVTWIGSPGLGVLSLSVNNGTPILVNTGAGGVSSASQTTITCPLGANVLKLKWSSGAGVYIIGIEAYDSSKAWVSVINAGWGGAGVAALATNGGGVGNPWHPFQMIANINPDLTIINIGINDWNAGTGVPTYTTTLQSIITQALTKGDVLLVTPNTTNAAASRATQLTYVNALYSLAQTNNVPLVDLWNSFDPWATYNTAGMFFDTLHPNGDGYADIAQAIFDMVNV